MSLSKVFSVIQCNNDFSREKYVFVYPGLIVFSNYSVILLFQGNSCLNWEAIMRSLVSSLFI